ncbi:hypothetical protein [Schaalia sp. lx-260]|uniref:hypothetical protein n=1 Tax=Schaalia sp. lx-260 TaxID=2899082 RepID=UPI001E326063|nr:hypothetical protein [Schaalia sp. lx-260]MCD4549694.1 hypothetical protein [Schaalia sp. lx-260]
MCEKCESVVWVPLSVRKACFEAVRAVEPVVGLDTHWLYMEAVLEALQPFLVGLVAHPERATIKPVCNEACTQACE